MNILCQRNQPIVEQGAEKQQAIHLHLIGQRQHRFIVVFRGDIQQQGHIAAALQLAGDFVQQRENMRVF
ncbi:hypothetical protein D3C80_1446410 [compost metagenome]